MKDSSQWREHNSIIFVISHQSQITRGSKAKTKARTYMPLEPICPLAKAHHECPPAPRTNERDAELLCGL
jgi:hypothetical protein